MAYIIALVDDEQSVAGQLENLISEYGEKNDVSFEIYKFSNTSEFFSSGIKRYDVIFLDINLPNDMNGLETAKKLRAEGSRAVIIFCTNYAQYAINGYEVGALSYIIKPVEKTSFDNSMDRAVNMLKHRVEHKMLVRTVEGQELINISELMYVEVMVHNLFFHIKKGDESVVVRTRGSLNEVSDRLSNLSFARCSSCYLVNLSYVTCVGKKELQLSDGHSLAISRKFVKEFTNKFMRYIAEFGVIDG